MASDRTGGPPKLAVSARRELLAGHGGPTAALGAYPGLCLGYASDDLPPPPTVSDLYARFLGWLPLAGESAVTGGPTR